MRGWHDDVDHPARPARRTDGAQAALVGASLPAVAGSTATAAPAPQKGERVQIAGPQQVSKKEWEVLVGKMMEVKVSAAGVPTEPAEFSEADEAKDAWTAWNRSRDTAVSK